VASKFYFCLNFFHPNEVGKPAAPDAQSRFFASNEPGCPTCPTCEKQVSAAEVPDDQTLPFSVVEQLARSQHEITV
jgi:hypothetical protein